MPDDVLAVRVFLQEGRPAFGARVFLTRPSAPDLRHADEARTDGHGRCTLRVEPRERALAADLVALLPGCQPAVLEDALRWHRDHPREEAELHLGGEPLRITGHVLRADGRPAEGWRVGVLDGTLVDSSRTLEDLVSGLATGSLGPEVLETTSDGSFAIERLLEREYMVIACEPRLEHYALAERVRAGTEILLRERENGDRTCTVRVVGWNGTPVAGRTVEASLLGDRGRFGVAARAMETDEGGEARFERLPLVALSVHVLGEHPTEGWTDADLPAWPAGGEVEIRIDRLCALRIHTPSGWDVPRYLRVEGGRERRHYRVRGESHGTTAYALAGGETHLVWVPESTTHLRVEVGDLPHERAPRLAIGPLDPDAPPVELHL